MKVDYVPNVDISKVFHSTIMLVNDIENSENGLSLIQAGADGPPIHKHPKQEETFKVIQGKLEVYHTDKWVTLSEGESLEIPKNTPHTFRSRDTEDCIFEYVVTPKGGFSEMLQSLESLSKTEKIKSTSDLKSLIYLSMAFQKHKNNYVSVEPPPFVISTLAGIGKVLQFKL